jgi:hypothetical protein
MRGGAAGPPASEGEGEGEGEALVLRVGLEEMLGEAVEVSRAEADSLGAPGLDVGVKDPEGKTVAGGDMLIVPTLEVVLHAEGVYEVEPLTDVVTVAVKLIDAVPVVVTEEETLREGVPVTLPEFERVTEPLTVPVTLPVTVTEPLRLPETVPLPLSEGAPLTEPLPVLLPLTEAVSESVPRAESLGDGLPVTEAVPLALALPPLGEAERLSDVRAEAEGESVALPPEAEALPDGLSTHVWLALAEPESESVVRAEAETLGEPEGEALAEGEPLPEREAALEGEPVGGAVAEPLRVALPVELAAGEALPRAEGDAL